MRCMSTLIRCLLIINIGCSAVWPFESLLAELLRSPWGIAVEYSLLVLGGFSLGTMLTTRRTWPLGALLVLGAGCILFDLLPVLPHLPYRIVHNSCGTCMRGAILELKWICGCSGVIGAALARVLKIRNRPVK